MNITKLHKKLIGHLKECSSEINTEQSQNLYEINTLGNEFSANEHSLKIIIDLNALKILTISNNLETLTGYSQEDYKKENFLVFLRSICVEHLLAPITFTRWAIEVFKAQPSNASFEAMKLVICGINVNHKNGKKMQVLMRLKPLELAENGYPRISIITFDFITHLLKPNDYWWARCSYGEDDPLKYHILSNDKKHYNHDILSNREKDVLKLIEEGLDSRAIAEQLFISQNTVENHRRNTVLRSGTRDSTGLVQICKMCGIF